MPRLSLAQRWLLPLVALLALLGQSVTAWAAAGVIGETECCCPQPKTCKCHDHDRSHDSELRACKGDSELVLPARLVAAPPAAAVVSGDVAAVVSVPPSFPAMPAERSEPPEKPPF